MALRQAGWHRLLACTFGVVCLCLPGTVVFAQDQAQDQSETVEVAPSAAVDTSPTVSSPVSKRLFGVIPNYRADQAQGTYKPLTVEEKFHIARSDSFDWPNFPLLAGYALESQIASGGFGHNGGFKGFGESYARSVGDQILGSYVTEAILPSLLHEDPRFFRLGIGSFWHRVSYASSRVFVTRSDNGHSRFNVSEIAGNASFVALATLYYPDSRTAGEGAERFGMQLGNDVVSNLMTELWPDIKHYLRYRRYPFFIH
jgi:hypothetical protein